MTIPPSALLPADLSSVEKKVLWAILVSPYQHNDASRNSIQTFLEMSPKKPKELNDALEKLMQNQLIKQFGSEKRPKFRLTPSGRRLLYQVLKEPDVGYLYDICKDIEPKYHDILKMQREFFTEMEQQAQPSGSVEQLINAMKAEIAAEVERIQH